MLHHTPVMPKTPKPQNPKTPGGRNLLILTDIIILNIDASSLWVFIGNAVYLNCAICLLPASKLLHLSSLAGKACCILLLFYSGLLFFCSRSLFLIRLFFNFFHPLIFLYLLSGFLVNPLFIQFEFRYCFIKYLFSTRVLK